MALNRISKVTTAGVERAPNRAMLRAVGFGDDDFVKPIVGVANGYSTITPCNAGLGKLADAAIGRWFTDEFRKAHPDVVAVHRRMPAPHDAGDAQVRAIWKAALSQAHPDRARARGLPSEFIEVAEAKSAAINAAFDEIMRERRNLPLQGAA